MPSTVIKMQISLDRNNNLVVIFYDFLAIIISEDDIDLKMATRSYPGENGISFLATKCSNMMNCLVGKHHAACISK